MALFIIPLIAAGVQGSIAGLSVSGLLGAFSASVTALLTAEAVVNWLESNTGAELCADQLNKRLAAAGLDLEFPPFNPLTDAGREIFKRTIEGFALDRLNAKAGTNFTKVADLTPANFEIELGRILSGQINNATGANFTALWPAEKLQDQLKTEVLRQFDNRGRYAAGALFNSGTMQGIKAKIAAKHPGLMLALVAPKTGGLWGPARDQAHQIKRDKAKLRQEKYRRTHQQVWVNK